LFFVHCGLFATTTQEPVGHVGANRINTPVNQVLTPAGVQVQLPGMRPQALALSPDGELLVTSGKNSSLVGIDPRNGDILGVATLPSDDLKAEAVSPRVLEPDLDGQLSFTGLIFSQDGSRIFMSSVLGSVKVFGVDRQHIIRPLFSIAMPRTGITNYPVDIPAGLALSPDGSRLYVALNLLNRLGEFDAKTGKLLRAWAVGVAPYDVVLAGGEAYVSNWGGRRPMEGSLTGPAGLGTKVRVDPVRHIASEGSVSVIDLQAGRMKTEILTGLHASALALSPNGRYLVAANAASDTLSVIDTTKDEVVETIWTRQSPADLFGASPNALTFDRSGKLLFVCNGTQNAVAMIQFEPGKSELLGLIPVGWFPGAIVHDSRRDSIYVANIKGIALAKVRDKETGETGFNSHQYQGTLSMVRVPAAAELASHTRTALNNLRYPLLAEAKLPARPDQPARPVPERVGEPSVFKHVVYIIKENRTYDQVLGDMREGNGDSRLCMFGERITPNHHKLAREFVLLDNTYCSGILSADGHQWTDSAFATDYMERSFAGFPRSYPDGMADEGVDALAYSPAGFIWDSAIAHGKTLRDYGEFAISQTSWKDKKRAGKPKFTDYYNEFIKGTDTIHFSSRPGIESLRPYLATNTVGWDLAVPDVFRAAQFIKELKNFEESGNFPNLTIMSLPNDHTSATKASYPTPAAQMADNDLALGRIVEALSRSRFWKETCIFIIEDDPQNGFDHVSGYRTVAYVVSPYTKRRQVISTQYNQTSVLRTMELILGLPPMNQMDATATPMSDCFTVTPDLTPYTALSNNIPLNRLNPAARSINDRVLRRDAYASEKLPLDEVDKCPEDELNRILWHAMMGSYEPYPVWAVKLVKDDDDD
jgi:YVTN family beta-propeller protein